ncbi:MAG: VWA domain-containing protein [Candidatus Lokiarchaeota archaeon]|nr:VWA domain-containing protein [Candidatus Lokiarchaeota archaeon]MBD3201276.1 VWA domain-containing protein [Candidatus Lokiarchaeota archaeon]
MQDIKVEDTVLLIDSSRSMMRYDFKPNRLYIALKSAKKFITTKINIDPKDRISILSFGDITTKLQNFSNETNKLLESLDKVSISGKGLLHDGIAFALQILVEQMRRIGGKIPRIFIITDNKIEDIENLEKIVNIANGLGVIIDSLQIGKTQDYRNNILKRISKLTGGEFGFFANERAVINAGKAFASKKNANKHTDYFSPEKKEKIPPLMNEIALPLRRPTIMEVRLMMDSGGNGQKKCQICHSKKAPLTNADFFSEGRFCPSCERPMHLSCAALWAKKTEYTKTIFRCPFCYFLLRVPSSVLKLIGDDIESTQKIQIIDEEEAKTTKMKVMPDNRIPKIDSSCSYCHSIFMGDYQVFQCENCGSYYHKPCLEKMYKEIQACRYCGRKITY